MHMFLKKFCVLSCVVAGFLTPLAVGAQRLDDGRAPLVTIRFNQPNVYFDQQLTSAVTHVLQAKPDVMFDVVAFAPATGDPSIDRQWQGVAGRNTRNVVNAMTGLGITMDRMNVIGKSTAGLKFDETHIYVR